MAFGRALTPEEKRRYHDFLAAEILRRRNGDAGRNPEGAAEAEAEVDAEVAARRAAGGAKCPECGTPYGKARRCYRCKPPNPTGRGSPLTTRSKPVPAAGPAVVVTPKPEPVIPEMIFTPPPPVVATPIIDVDNSAPIIDVDNGMVSAPVPAPDHIADVGNMVEMVGNGKPDPIAALRRVVDALAGLDADAVRWVLDSAARLPREGGRP